MSVAARKAADCDGLDMKSGAPYPVAAPLQFYQMGARDMIRDMRSALWICAALFIAPALGADDVSGIWTGQIAGRNGEPQDITFRFKQEGTVLTGKMYGDGDDIPITAGKIAGD